MKRRGHIVNTPGIQDSKLGPETDDETSIIHFLFNSLFTNLLII